MPTHPSGQAIQASDPQERLDDSLELREEAVRPEVGLDPLDELDLARREAIHAARGEWLDLAELYAAQADAPLDPAERAAALCRAARVRRVRLGDGGAARALLGVALAICPAADDLPPELEASAAESPGAAEEIRAMLAGAARQAPPAIAAELWLVAAWIDAAVRRDEAAAIDALDRVTGPFAGRAGELLDRIERHAAGRLLERLAHKARGDGDRPRERRALLRSLDQLTGDERAERHRAIAELTAADGDDELAAWHRREAEDRGTSPAAAGAVDHGRSTDALAELAWTDERWADLEPLVDRLLQIGRDGGDNRALLELHHRAGRAAAELGKRDKATRHYRQALAIDPVHLGALVGLAPISADLAGADQAHDLYGAVLLVQRSLAHPAADLADTLHRMGEMRERGGKIDEAIELHEGALDVHPLHRAALDAATRLHRERGDLRRVEALLRAVLPRAGRRRVDLSIELAGLQSRFLGEADAAVALIRQALAAAPGERRLLLALVEHCHAAGEWDGALEALTQLADQEESPYRRGRYYHMAGRLAQSRPGAAGAIAHLERALDSYFAAGAAPPDERRADCLRAFRDVESILRGRADAKGLEAAYRAMIRRLAPGAPELPQLWTELGALEREPPRPRADRPAAAPILLDLHQSAGPDELDKLIARRRLLLAAEPFRAEHYSALRSLFVKTNDLDGVFCASRALVFLDRADRDASEFHRRHRQTGVVWPVRPLKSADWRRLRHADEDPLVASVFALIAERVALSVATTPRRLRLRSEATAELDDVRRLYARTSDALGISEPALYLIPSMEVDAVLANLGRATGLAPAFVVGRHMAQGRTAPQMVQTMARGLTYLRPHAYLRLLFGSASDVAAAFAAGCAIGGGTLDGVAGDTVIRFADALRRQSGRTWLSELRAAVRRLRDRDHEMDIGRYCRALDATSRRAGLLLSGALDIAAADLHREPVFARRRPRTERLADVLVHSVSEEHLALRKDLQLAAG